MLAFISAGSTTWPSSAPAAPARSTAPLTTAARGTEGSLAVMPAVSARSATSALAAALVAGASAVTKRRRRPSQACREVWARAMPYGGSARGSRVMCHASMVSEAPVAPSEPSKIRVRFAPSPTGVLHVGGARTALFNWLFAKSQGGELVLRVEDTDTARSTAESEAAILEGLKWCGITWDEGPDVGGAAGPYRQSERIKAGIYQEQLDKLVAQGDAYRCFLTPEELDAMRAEAERNEQAFVIQSPWASAKEEEVQAMIDEGKPYVYRFRVPFDREIVVDDLVLGEVIWNSDDLGGDFVIVRQNGMPMYNFGVVVDDAQMGISHVLRAQEHLMNTPRQILMYEALGLKAPTFGHMPLILAPDRTKLSKRHGAVSVGEYQRRGYLPSGMVNYLAQLGWNDGTKQEIYSIEELKQAFKMNRMSKVAAIFDTDKFKWVNGHHIRLLDDEKAVDLLGALLKESELVKEVSGNFVRKASVLLRERVSTLQEAVQELKDMMHFDLEDMLSKDVAKPYLEDGSLKETARLILEAKERGDFEAIGSDPQVFKTLAKTISEARGGVKKKALLVPLRLCLTSSDHGPDMNLFFEMLKEADDNVICPVVSLEQRLEALREKFEL
eukprot:TRINITY_DN90556_c0_g1_i1.p1 TRINITY_DN90556_c0_g1~~TRINITY_DN90556_c0_g1_i1.p1  ORF type:complete len:642 (-),score=144.71 TRINITY_DN90556_c0_g1_i1:180-2018(-)